MAAPQAPAYPAPVDFDGSLLRWPIAAGDGPVTYEVKATRDLDLTLYGPAVADAVALWNDIPASYFRYALADADLPAQVTVNLDRVTSGAPFSAGYAIFDEYAGTKPLHCSIHITLDAASYYQAVAKTILHELGHCLGLGHTLIPEAIMSYSLDKNTFGLDVDDEAAATRLYPADGTKPGLPPGCAVASTAAHPAIPALLLLLLPLATLLPRRGRAAAGPQPRQ